MKKEAEKILIRKELTTEIQRIWKWQSKCDISNNRGNWNNLTIIQQIPEQYT